MFVPGANNGWFALMIASVSANVHGMSGLASNLVLKSAFDVKS